jgi:ribA/ribD-fused uncharacterized protein
MEAIIRKVREEHGWFGNMSHHPVVHEGKSFFTAEALFQSLRFSDESIKTSLAEIKNPMKAKFFAKARVDQMTVKPMSEADLENMRLVLRLKIEQHEEVRQALIDTGDILIVEDCTKRQHGSGLFWGAAQVDGAWQGQNWLGRLWMELRETLK